MIAIRQILLVNFGSESHWRFSQLTLGGGLCGPALNVEPRREKHWPPPSNQTRTQYVIGLIKDKDIKDYIFKTWLEMCKHYDTDYYEED